MTKVLLTAFEPYDNWKTNASWLALVDLTRDLPAEPQITTRLYPVDFDQLRERLAQDLAENFDVTLHLGQAPGSGQVQLESIGLNIAAGPNELPENCKKLVKDGDTAYRSPLPLSRWAQQLRSAGIPTQVSHHAGTYLCNAALYLALHHNQDAERHTRSGFIHIPLDPTQVASSGIDMPSMSSRVVANGLRLILDDLERE
jgi:pyroglutamyl-peptidase